MNRVGSVCGSSGRSHLSFGWSGMKRNPTGCARFDAQQSLGHTFRAPGNTASVTSANGITRNMTQTSPGVYTADRFTWGSVTFHIVVNAASSPKSLTVTEPTVGCRWNAVAP